MNTYKTHLRNVTILVGSTTMLLATAGLAPALPGTVSAGFSAQTKINRKDWGLNWNVALETGGWLVGDEVRIDLELEIVKQAVPAQQLEAVLA